MAAGEVKVEAISWLAPQLGGSSIAPLRLAAPVGEGERLRDVLARLAAQNAAFARFVFDPAAGTLQPHVNVIVNGLTFELAGGLDAPLRQDDEIILLPAFAGGC